MICCCLNLNRRHFSMHASVRAQKRQSMQRIEEIACPKTTGGR
ncbi:hypothetical protein SynA1825c_00087 [Synechococcus sp. A18-25c]|nr:hypothetical protein SynA1825c_00087 [Synechococcus sp. A18-25c]